jgi:hypothetical protein
MPPLRATPDRLRQVLDVRKVGVVTGKEEVVRTFRVIVGIVRFPFMVPLFLRCFFMGVRCGRLGIDLSDEEVVALCR